jgi:hypothetical protein
VAWWLLRIRLLWLVHYGCRESAQLVHPPQCCYGGRAGALVGAGRSTAAASCAHSKRFAWQRKKSCSKCAIFRYRTAILRRQSLELHGHRPDQRHPILVPGLRHHAARPSAWSDPATKRALPPSEPHPRRNPLPPGISCGGISTDRRQLRDLSRRRASQTRRKKAQPKLAPPPAEA